MSNTTLDRHLDRAGYPRINGEAAGFITTLLVLHLEQAQVWQEPQFKVAQCYDGRLYAVIGTVGYRIERKKDG